MTRLAGAARLAPALVATALLAAGCTSTVPQADVEDEITTQYQPVVPGGEATCPSDLEATEGETMDCTMTDPDGNEFTIRVTVTSTDGDTANFDMELVE